MGMARGEPHSNETVREFLDSPYNASHLFFAKHVLPDLDTTDMKIDGHITSLARRLRDVQEEVQHENL